MSTGSRIKELRTKRGYTQGYVAEKLGMDRANLSNYERDVAIPPGPVLVALADILGTTTDYLLLRTDSPFPLHAYSESATTDWTPEEIAIAEATIQAIRKNKKE